MTTQEAIQELIKQVAKGHGEKKLVVSDGNGKFVELLAIMNVSTSHENTLLPEYLRGDIVIYCT